MEADGVTWSRVMCVWWLVAWRWFVGSVVIGFLVSFLVNFVWAFAGPVGGLFGAVGGLLKAHSHLLARLLTIPWSVMVIRQSLRKQYRGFSLRIVEQSPMQAPAGLAETLREGEPGENDGVTWSRVIRAWWLVSWRCYGARLLLDFLLSFLVAFVRGFANRASSPFSPSNSYLRAEDSAIYLLAYLIVIPWSVVVVRQCLRKRYKGFSLWVVESSPVQPQANLAEALG
jgi:hypothetical protein